MGKRKAYYTGWKTIQEDSEDLQAHPELVAKLMKQLGISKYSLAGSGTMENAYFIPNNKILKVTTDKTEATESLKIKGRNMKHLANIFEVYALSGNYAGIYVIITEQLHDQDKVRRLNETLQKFLDDVFDENVGYVFMEYRQGSLSESDMEARAEEMSRYFVDDDKTLREVREYFFDRMGIIHELEENNINTIDYNNIRNQGYKKNGNLALFDLGYGDQEKPEDITYLNLREDLGALTKFEKPESSDRRLRDSMQFTGKDGQTFYISDRRNPMMIIASVMSGDGLRPIGYLYLHHKKDNIYVPDAGKNMAVQVNPEYRRLGIATAMYDYAEGVLDLEVIPASLQHDAAKAVWKKRRPDLFEFLSADEYPDFLDGQANPTMAGRPYPPMTNPSRIPMSEEEISQEELDVKSLPIKYAKYLDDFVLEVTEAEIREIAPTIDLERDPAAVVSDIKKNYPELYDNFAQWLRDKGLR